MGQLEQICKILIFSQQVGLGVGFGFIELRDDSMICLSV